MDSLLVHRCKIQTRTATANDFGEKTYTWADTYTGVHCRLSHPKGSLTRLESGEFVTKTPTLFLKSDQTVAETYRVVGTTGFTETYEVMKVKKYYDSISLQHIECELRAVV